MKITAKDEQRFWALVNKTDGCWLWAGSLNRAGGYGRFAKYVLGSHASTVGAHRFSYILAHGEIPDGLVVRHTCDTPACVNPSHLVLGTQQDNVQDQIDRGRKAIGERAGCATLSDKDVQLIRQSYLEGGISQSEIARCFGVDKRTINRIVRNQARVNEHSPAVRQPEKAAVDHRVIQEQGKMQHRYIVWEGRYRGRRFTEMHIIDQENQPICKTRKPNAATDEAIWKGRPEGLSLCRRCMRERQAFEQHEELRTWRELAK
jgi:hypothetical protein